MDQPIGLWSTVHDARRFIFHHRTTFELAPLQVYYAGLLFSPEDSIVRQTYFDKYPQKVRLIGSTEKDWSPCLQTFEGHRGSVESLVFSEDGLSVASASLDGTAKLWDVQTGSPLYT